MQLKSVDFHLSLEHKSEYLHILRRGFPTPRPGPLSASRDKSSRAFQLDSQARPNGANPSKIGFNRILKYCEQYKNQKLKYHSPYTSILVPVGLESLIQFNNWRRSIIFTDTIPFKESMERLIIFFDAMILLTLQEISLCRDIGITPAAYFAMQMKSTEESETDYPSTFAQHMRHLWDSVIESGQALADYENNDYYQTLVSLVHSFENDRRAILQKSHTKRRKRSLMVCLPSSALMRPGL